MLATNTLSLIFHGKLLPTGPVFGTTSTPGRSSRTVSMSGQNLPRPFSTAATGLTNQVESVDSPTLERKTTCLSFAQIEECIRARAYEIYEELGHRENHALDDWLEAKAEVLGVVKKN